MKIQVLSDLHLECRGIDQDIADVDSDAVVLAGDIHPGSHGIDWAAATWKEKPVIYVPGNHEYYRLVYQKQRSAMRKTASQHFNVRLLDQNACVIGGVLFVGCTLWTDFRYFETSGNFSGEEAMNVARRFMPDFSVIRYMDEHGNYMKFKPEHSARICARELAYIQSLLRMDSTSITTKFGVDEVRARVVVTHHLPSAKSVHPQFAESALTPSFASRFEETVAMADLWIHGHTHHRCDYRLKVFEGQARAHVVCNPRGYCESPEEPENSSFDQHLVVSV